MFFTKKYKKMIKENTRLINQNNQLIRQVYNMSKKTLSSNSELVNIENSIKIEGENNTILLIDSDGKTSEFELDFIADLKIEIIGDNNTVILPKDAIWLDSSIYINSNNSTLTIKNTNLIVKLDVYMKHGDNQSVIIDEKFSSGGCLICLIEKDIKVKIGKDCMFSTDICLMAGDGHTIKDKISKQIINFSDGIIIGDHVWIGKYAKIAKNSTIPSNSIVGMGAIVSGKFDEENVVLAGVPAKVVKKNIEWQRDSISFYK